MKDYIVKNKPNSRGLSRWLSGKESSCQAGDASSIPGLGRSPGEGDGNPLQYSCLENPMDRGAWWATVHGVTKGWTRLNTHSQTLLTAQPLILLSGGSYHYQYRVYLSSQLPLLKNLTVYVGPTYSYYRYITYLFIQTYTL